MTPVFLIPRNRGDACVKIRGKREVEIEREDG
jgi:hypothetical protein